MSNARSSTPILAKLVITPCSQVQTESRNTKPGTSQYRAGEGRHAGISQEQEIPFTELDLSETIERSRLASFVPPAFPTPECRTTQNGSARPVFPQSVPRAWPPPPHVHAVGPQIATPSGPRASPGLSPMLLARLAPATSRPDCGHGRWVGTW
ncbi:hypothetical protein NEUTE1DRAFT_101303 [Neurospora tetrasperma FGSC 2508]|uniref:Uncharacterized protein n=1 Tax=Neurospora tetrasperma (strain FGSC 2508 / ATCC MYA-4615 / P0657) TaxID=510951 RepID=F8MLW5_NEUT8|nr:uncharacterized protein NEUTE1DRAFT_101303 [Neurospora tetrasperma FGSC 2508]EGO58480.1 hypothetical protein NEUTE1DRAFT_101303 [Neurospora tetrasperma FGSC 2508]